METHAPCRDTASLYAARPGLPRHIPGKRFWASRVIARDTSHWRTAVVSGGTRVLWSRRAVWYPGIRVKNGTSPNAARPLKTWTSGRFRFWGSEACTCTLENQGTILGGQLCCLCLWRVPWRSVKSVSNDVVCAVSLSGTNGQKKVLAVATQSLDVDVSAQLSSLTSLTRTARAGALTSRHPGCGVHTVHLCFLR